MQSFAPEVVSIADACLGGLRGRSALLIGPEQQRQPYAQLLQGAGMKYIHQEERGCHLGTLLPQVQLLMSIPEGTPEAPVVSAAAIAQGCVNRRVPLIIFDLAERTSVEELAGLLPFVCLYTPDDLRRILARAHVKLG